MGKIATVLTATLLVACGGGKGKGACEQGSCLDAATPDGDGGTGDGARSDAAAQPDAAPCTSRLEVQTSGAFNADLPVVQVSGTVTVNGQPMPASPHDRGHLELRDQDGHARSMPGFGASGPGTYSGGIFAGTYDVVYRHAPACQQGDPIPCQDHLIKKAVALNASGKLDLDLVVVQVSGTVTVNGQPLPASPHDRGHLDFQDQDSHARSMQGFGTSGPGTYNGDIFAGTYDVVYRHAPACQHGDPIPCQDHLAKKTVALNASGKLDMDLVVVQVSGTVTVNGQPMPASPNERGHLDFQDQDSHARSMQGFGTSGPGTYSGDIFAGTYDVVYRHAPGCQHDDPIPCQDHLAKKTVALNASGSLNLDLVVVQVSGTVTVNGQPLPASPNERGHLDFQDQDGHARSMPDFGASGPGTYSGDIFAGTHDVTFRHAPACQHDDPIPCQDHLAKKSVALNASGSLDLDLMVVQLSGQITVNAKPMPDSPHDRGHLELRDQDGLARSMPGFGPSGPGTYSGDLFAGSYDVVYRHAPACQHDDPIPCQDHLLRGCPARTD